MEMVFVGKVINTHGIKGEFRIKSDFELKSRVFKIGNEIFIGSSSYKITSYRVHKGFDMITINGFNNINEVIPFKGKNVYVKRETLDLGDNEYILEDLIKCKVILNEETIGEVVDYMVGVNTLLEVKGIKTFYIPVKAGFIKGVNNEKHEIYVTDDTKGLIL